MAWAKSAIFTSPAGIQRHMLESYHAHQLHVRFISLGEAEVSRCRSTGLQRQMLSYHASQLHARVISLGEAKVCRCTSPAGLQKHMLESYHTSQLRVRIISQPLQVYSSTEVDAGVLPRWSASCPYHKSW